MMLRLWTCVLFLLSARAATAEPTPKALDQSSDDDPVAGYASGSATSKAILPQDQPVPRATAASFRTTHYLSLVDGHYEIPVNVAERDPTLLVLIDRRIQLSLQTKDNSDSCDPRYCSNATVTEQEFTSMRDPAKSRRLLVELRAQDRLIDGETITFLKAGDPCGEAVAPWLVFLGCCIVLGLLLVWQLRVVRVKRPAGLYAVIWLISSTGTYAELFVRNGCLTDSFDFIDIPPLLAWLMALGIATWLAAKLLDHELRSAPVPRWLGLSVCLLAAALGVALMSYAGFRDCQRIDDFNRVDFPQPLSILPLLLSATLLGCILVQPQRIEHKLGKNAPRVDARTLQLGSYLPSGAAPPPGDEMVDWSGNVLPSAWGELCNDTISDCTVAAAGHLIMQWTSQHPDTMVTPTDDQIVSAYSAVAQYRPQDPSTDRGASALAVLKYWRNSGIAGHKIDAFVAIDPQNLDHIRLAIRLLGGAYLGFNLPWNVEDELVWDVSPEGNGVRGSWGGHAVSVAGYDSKALTVISWGRPRRVTWAFVSAYCDEAYAIVSRDFMKDGVAVNGLDLDHLRAAAAACEGLPPPAQ